MENASSDVRKSKPVLKKVQTPLRTGFSVLLSFFIISFLIIEGLVIADSKCDNTDIVDYVVVLGAGLYGETPSPALYNRLTSAVEYIKQYPDVEVVVSGGQGPDELITEAEAMKRFLLKHGVKEGQIIKEEESTSTMENLSYN